MRTILGVLILALSTYAYSEADLLVGKSNFSGQALDSAIQMLKSDLPGRPPRCGSIEKIYSKILEESASENGKIFSKERWLLSGCDGASSVIAILHPSGLVSIKDK